MKILAVSQIKEADAYTIAHEPIASIDLMERAAQKCFAWIQQNMGRNKSYKIFCGKGNNGGDGLAMARMMAEKNIKVETYIVCFSDKSSADFEENYKRLAKLKKATLFDITITDDLPIINESDIIIDAVFGSGLSQPVTKGIALDTIDHLNKSKATIIAIDIPSGLFCDDNSENNGQVIHAKYTLTFQFPKLAFLFAGNEKFVGNWVVLPIGLHSQFIQKVDVNNFYVEEDDCRNSLKHRNKFAHKGTFGHALLVCGSRGKMGAAVLAAKACLKSGAGLVTSHIPECGYVVMQTAVPETMCEVDSDKDMFSDNLNISVYNAIGVGSGIGTHEQTQKALKQLIQNSGNPIVFDADAINILAQNPTWVSFVPKNSIFTPHPKEFERLVGKSTNEIERQKLQIAFSKRNAVYVILKGANTCISTPAGDCYFNSTGNPGMATAGSGDLLTGILTAMLAQGYSSFETCVLGVFVHGLAGDFATKLYGYEATTASEIINMLGKAFKKLY
ncbi:MAG: NAD(P)H-hydrate dehydratase [Bacteroidota bacterium]